MTDQNEFDGPDAYEYAGPASVRNGDTTEVVANLSPFTRSNGTMLSRLYERLTKASRRRHTGSPVDDNAERAYRQGVYDAFKTLQEELVI